MPSDLLSALNPKILPRVKRTYNIILHHLVWLGNVFLGRESKHPSLPLARAERKPFDRKKKLNPRYQREIPLNENLALLQQQSAPAREPFLVLFWHAKENLAFPQPRFTPRNQRARPLSPLKKKSQCSTWNTGSLPLTFVPLPSGCAPYTRCTHPFPPGGPWPEHHYRS